MNTYLYFSCISLERSYTFYIRHKGQGRVNGKIPNKNLGDFMLILPKILGHGLTLGTYYIILLKFGQDLFDIKNIQITDILRIFLCI